MGIMQGCHRPKDAQKPQRLASFSIFSLLCQEYFIMYIVSPGSKLLRDLLFSIIFFYVLTHSNTQLNMLKYFILLFFWLFFPLYSSCLQIYLTSIHFTVKFLESCLYLFQFPPIWLLTLSFYNEIFKTVQWTNRALDKPFHCFLWYPTPFVYLSLLHLFLLRLFYNVIFLYSVIASSSKLRPRQFFQPTLHAHPFPWF